MENKMTKYGLLHGVLVYSEPEKIPAKSISKRKRAAASSDDEGKLKPAKKPKTASGMVDNTFKSRVLLWGFSPQLCLYRTVWLRKCPKCPQTSFVGLP